MYRSYAEAATPYSLTFRRRVSCLCCVAYGIQLLRFFLSQLGLLARPKFETPKRFILATWTFSTMLPVVGFSKNLCFVCLQAKTPSKNEYQHFIPKFILRKYDAEYQEPDLAAFRAKHEGDMSKADKEWKKEKKKVQKRSSVRAVVFEKISKSNSSAEQVAARIARKEAVKVQKESKRKSSAEVVEFGNEEMTMSATAQSLSIELFGEDIKIRIEGRNCSKICGELDMYEKLLRWWPFAVVVSLFLLVLLVLARGPLSLAVAMGAVFAARHCCSSCWCGKEKLDIETGLSKMEMRMAEIVKTLEEDMAANKESSRLTQTQLYQIHHFLFIMFYRGRSFFKHYDVTEEQYKGTDKASLVRFMKTHWFANPLAVWHHTLRALISSPPGTDFKAWENELLEKKAYPPDVSYFVDHVKNYEICFCRPQHADDAFILAPNAFSVYDSNLRFERGRAISHVFASMGPSFLILLRRRSKPRPSRRSMSPDWCANRPLEESSWLYRLPVEAPSKVDDNFVLKYHFIAEKYVSRINSIMLENAADTDLIVYSTIGSLGRALQLWYSEQEEAVASMLIGGAEPRIKSTADEIQLRQGGREKFDGDHCFRLLFLRKLWQAIEEVEEMSEADLARYQS